MILNNNNSVISKSAEYVRQFIENRLPGWAVYHNLSHTMETVQCCIEMAEHYNLIPLEKEKLVIAAWFHDTGYVNGAENHEEISMQVASEFLRKNEYEKDSLLEVLNLIRITKMSEVPDYLSGYILRDADLVSLGREDYFVTNELLRQEVEVRENRMISQTEWLRRSEEFLLSHRYLTDYASSSFNVQIEINLKELRKKLTFLSSKDDF